jgi:hypothetical protein
MLYGSHYMEATNGIKTGDGINGIKVGDGVNGANGINGNGANGINSNGANGINSNGANGISGVQTGNAIKMTNDKKAVDALNGVAHT